MLINVVNSTYTDYLVFDNVVPGGGFEPPTRGFSVLCSCTNLLRHIKDLTKIKLRWSHLRHTEDVKMATFRKRNGLWQVQVRKRK